MEIYSQKAEAIIKAYYDVHDYRKHAFSKKANGAFVIPSRDAKDIVSSLLYYTKQEDIVNTIRTRSQDERPVTLWKIEAPAKTFSLLAALMNGMYAPEALRRHWGDEAVDEMVGKPLNVLETQKRTVIMAEIERLSQEMKDKRSKAYDEHLAKDEAATKELRKAICELRCRITQLCEEQEKLNAKKSEISKALYAEYNENDKLMRDEYTAKIDKLKAELSQDSAHAQEARSN